MREYINIFKSAPGMQLIFIAYSLFLLLLMLLSLKCIRRPQVFFCLGSFFLPSLNVNIILVAQELYYFLPFPLPCSLAFLYSFKLKIIVKCLQDKNILCLFGGESILVVSRKAYLNHIYMWSQFYQWIFNSHIETLYQDQLQQ